MISPINSEPKVISESVNHSARRLSRRSLLVCGLPPARDEKTDVASATATPNIWSATCKDLKCLSGRIATVILRSHSPMITPKVVDDLVASVARLLPSTPADFERNLRAALTAAFDRLDLVTREELEVQEAVLARTRARLKEMEERIAALERGAEDR